MAFEASRFSGSRWIRCVTRNLLEELWASGKAPWKILAITSSTSSGSGFWAWQSASWVTGHTGFKRVVVGALACSELGAGGGRHQPAPGDHAQPLFPWPKSRNVCPKPIFATFRDASRACGLDSKQRRARDRFPLGLPNPLVRGPATGSRSQRFATNVMGTAHVLDALRGPRIAYAWAVIG